MSKQKFKSICWIFSVKIQNSTQYSGLFLSKSKIDLKKYDKQPVNIDQIDILRQKTKQNQINLFEFSHQSKNSNQFTGFLLSKHRCK